MPTSVESDVVVVGAGIGGLAAALALRRAGRSVRVIERASSPRELGFALLLASNAMYALRQLGVADVVIEGGCRLTTFEMRRASGDVLQRFDLQRASELLAEPMVAVLRPVLHGVLLEAVGNDSLALGCEVTGFRMSSSDAVEAVLGDGRTLRARCLVGADGVGSIIRRQLHPAEPPRRSSGLFGLRGVSHDAAPHLGHASGAQYLGLGVEAGLVRAGGSTVYWYISLPRRLVENGSAEPARVLERTSVLFDDTFRRITGQARPEDMRLDELFDREPMYPWGQGRVTLLGDAAHPMLPHAGQGAAQALEDAVALGRLLGGDRDVESGLREYERQRAPRSSTVVRLSRRSARMVSLESAMACRIRDAVIRMVPERLILKSIVAFGRPPEVDP